jgi:hypothetical protein
MEKIDEIRARIELRDKNELESIERDIDIAIRKGRRKKVLDLITIREMTRIRQEIDLEILMIILTETNG